jgi:hypothetical protein
MSIALHSAALAARMYLAHETAEHYYQQLQTHLRRRMNLATALSRAMVTSIGRSLMPLGLTLVPQAIGWIASWTRIPQQAMVAKPAPSIDRPLSTFTVRN